MFLNHVRQMAMEGVLTLAHLASPPRSPSKLGRLLYLCLRGRASWEQALGAGMSRTIRDTSAALATAMSHLNPAPPAGHGAWVRVPALPQTHCGTTGLYFPIYTVWVPQGTFLLEGHPLQIEGPPLRGRW